MNPIQVFKKNPGFVIRAVKGNQVRYVAFDDKMQIVFTDDKAQAAVYTSSVLAKGWMAKAKTLNRAYSYGLYST